MVMIRKIMEIMKDKSPYGIAKHGAFLTPVKHPRQATRRATIPMAMFPPPIPASLTP